MRAPPSGPGGVAESTARRRGGSSRVYTRVSLRGSAGACVQVCVRVRARAGPSQGSGYIGERFGSGGGRRWFGGKKEGELKAAGCGMKSLTSLCAERRFGEMRAKSRPDRPGPEGPFWAALRFLPPLVAATSDPPPCSWPRPPGDDSGCSQGPRRARRTVSSMPWSAACMASASAAALPPGQVGLGEQGWGPRGPRKPQGLWRALGSSQKPAAGLCLNCWSLQELVSRDPGHFLILLEQILQKTREVQEKGTYDLLAPLALLFYSTVLCTPHFPPDSDLLLKAARTYHRFLTWPVPYCSIYQELLTFIDAELKAPGISYQRLVRAEQGLSIRSHRSSTVTVLLLNPVEVQAEFLAVANRLSAPGHSPHSAYTTLLLHAFQATFGAHCDLPGLHCRLQSKSLAELEDIFTETAEAQELASSIGDAAEARQWLRTKLQAVGEKAGFPGVLDTAKPGKLCTIPIPVARCHTYNWNQDSFDVLQEILLQEQELLQPGILGDEEEEEEEEEDDDDLETEGRCARRDSLLSTSSAVFHDSTLPLASPQASGPTLSRQLLTSFVSGLSDGVDSGYVEDSEDSSSSGWPKRPGGQGRRLHRRPGQKFNRIYRLFKSTGQLVLRRDSRGAEGGGADAALPLRRAGSLCGPLDAFGVLPATCHSGSAPHPQQSLKAESRPLDGSSAQLPILADMLLYYCRFAARPVLLQVYQTELTFVTGEKMTEIFLHSLELGHSAATRAIKASGPGSKRLGIDGDREAIPLTLQIIYSKGAISGRSRWSSMEKVCTSVNLSKACRKPEELDSSMEALTLNLTEVVKRQNPKSKRGFNQISMSQIKVDKIQIIGSNGCFFAVCLDQDERKIVQSVVRCEVSPCYKPEKSGLRPQPQRTPDQPAQAVPDLCSLLCLPIMTFSGALP
ncbi:phosphoinositide 3-kinase [Lynx pardinus]|uniref:Phosphoinositide 3-kinase regulatory subunit 5 n=1 Tax=Lynx pardinus TaxID=191816 RepID=A0A485PL25_LYNPA|nr:phosphoinositide 3-kinase [Lynx pardinus]